MAIKVNNKLSVLTNVKEINLDKMFDVIIYILCDEIENALHNGENLIDFDLSIGTLKVQIFEDRIEYKFIPSLKLEKNITNTVYNRSNPLTYTLGESLKGKIEKYYKNYF